MLADRVAECVLGQLRDLLGPKVYPILEEKLEERFGGKDRLRRVLVSRPDRLEGAFLDLLGPEGGRAVVRVLNCSAAARLRAEGLYLFDV
ncbi:hypothetical protein [Nitrososphaera sp.]|uniref:hypothetical protein n=1 Tax=Nitrososphaera sp. TaxID=1971748 RepID=UPI00307F14CB